MTGYGKAETPFRGHKLICEIRSLNSKSMDLSVRLAAPLRAHELELRAIVNQRLERGKVDLVICEDSGMNDSDAGYTPVNWDVAKIYAEQYKTQFACDAIPDAVMAAILRFPDVLKIQEDHSDLSDEEWSSVQNLLNRSIDAFIAFRTQEGAALQAMFTQKLDGIAELLSQVEPFEKGRVAKIKERTKRCGNRSKSIGTGDDLLP